MHDPMGVLPNLRFDPLILPWGFYHLIHPIPFPKVSKTVGERGKQGKSDKNAVINYLPHVGRNEFFEGNSIKIVQFYQKKFLPYFV